MQAHQENQNEHDAWPKLGTHIMRTKTNMMFGLSWLVMNNVYFIST